MLLEKWFHVSINVNFTSKNNNGNISSVKDHITHISGKVSCTLGPLYEISSNRILLQGSVLYWSLWSYITRLVCWCSLLWIFLWNEKKAGVSWISSYKPSSRDWLDCWNGFFPPFLRTPLGYMPAEIVGGKTFESSVFCNACLCHCFLYQYDLDNGSVLYAWRILFLLLCSCEYNLKAKMTCKVLLFKRWIK